MDFSWERKRGRPRQTWITELNKAMMEEGLGEQLDWTDRKNQRQII